MTILPASAANPKGSDAEVVAGKIGAKGELLKGLAKEKTAPGAALVVVIEAADAGAMIP
eukprot:CAMPEP_0170487410 /NCGR_PEP_ID=MMETSP0208-20121228/6224_1 /TAXON_ID=197538 /ORGANISM="Strombidium inclinatum, Strain S3" /LENGTH=58 /DNA_ID=CAMNT_0010761675 /DNA_START=3381 /DNA_END=3557 /DNA_ORIENTATION=+